MPFIARFTIGSVRPAGFNCLGLSIKSFSFLYPNAKIVICHNNLPPEQKLPQVELFDQNSYVEPIGVAWKLYPPRLDINSHEIFIDNDLILEQKIEEIDAFLAGDMTLGLEADARHYGSLDRHVLPGYRINSGLFGLPPGFDLEKYMKVYGRWEETCLNARKTWLEQGLVAMAILDYKKHKIISEKVITNCEKELVMSKGMHFIGLNRVNFHRPFAEYKARKIF